jgi:Reverse transcriptase (RNA-dependent DNA polymerase)
LQEGQYESSVPVIADRAQQARVASALEPEWEARFEPRSYGFRPGRGCHDAIEAIYQAGKGASPARRWVLDADLAAAFDRIGHDHLLGQLGTFPARELIAGWLRAGVVENGRLAPTREGTPQGGVVSPALLNVALHGMEHAAGVRYQHTGSNAAFAAAGSPVLIRHKPTTWSPSATPGRKPSRSRRGSPPGWRPGAWPSTRTRRASSPSMRASTSSGSTSAAITASC